MTKPNRRLSLTQGIWIIVILLTIFRIGLFTRLPYYIIGESGYDDKYLLTLADSILNGRWLGSYLYTTLIKGISFPLFVVLSNLICMPYPMLLGIFYTVSSAVFALALKKLQTSPIIIAVSYLFMLYSPAGFSHSVTQRLYRNALVFPAVLLVFSLVWLIYLYRDDSIQKQIPLYILSGFAFSFFYYIREDSIWLLPLFTVPLIICIIRVLFFSGYDKKKRLIRALFFVTPIILFSLISLGYRFVNYKAYGVMEINDRTHGSFAELTGDMIRVADDLDMGTDYWISRNKMEKIIDACPSLVPCKETIMEAYDDWTGGSGDLKGDWSVWTFRIALDREGYYATATTADSFCKQVHDELLDAVNRGVLSFDDKIHFTSQSRGVSVEEIPSLINHTIKNIWRILSFSDAASSLDASEGSDLDIQFMRDITHVGIIEKEDLHFSGWLIVKDDAIKDYSVSIESDSGEKWIDALDIYERPDVQSVYPNYTHALKSGFMFDLPSDIDFADVNLAIYADNSLYARYDLSASDDQEDEKTHLYLDLQGQRTGNTNYSQRVVNASNRITRIYKIFNPVLTLLSLFSFVYLVIVFIRRRKWIYFDPAIICLGLLLSLFLCEFGVTVFTGWLSESSVWFYSIGIVPLVQCFIVISLVYTKKCFTRQVADKKRNIKSK